MYYSEKSGAHFHFLFNRLMIFAREVLEIEDDVIDLMTMKLNDEVAHEVIEELWDNRHLFDRFVYENPFGLNAKDLEIVRSWKQGLKYSYVLMEYNTDGAIFMSDGYAFCVQGITHGIKEMVPETPTLVSTILLPYDGKITYAMQISPAQLAFGRNILDMFAKEYEEIKQNKAIIASSDEFLAVANKIMEARGLRDIDEVIKKMERNSVPKDMVEPPSGFHRLQNTSMSEEEPDECFTAKDLNKYLAPDLKKKAYKAEPSSELLDNLLRLTRYRLMDLASEAGQTGLSKLNKRAIAETLAKRLANDKGSLSEILIHMNNSDFATFSKLCETGGLYSTTIDNIHQFGSSLYPEPPYLNLYWHDGQLTLLIPKALVALAKTLDWEELQRHRQQRDLLMQLGQAYTNLTGIISFEELYELYLECLEYIDDNISVYDYDTFFHMLLSTIGPKGEDYYPLYLESEDGDHGFYITHLYLSDIFLESMLYPRLVIDPENEELQARFHEGMANLDNYRNLLLERHAEIPIYHLEPSQIMGFDVFELVHNSPQTIRFEDFLNNHIPDGTEEEYVFAEDIIDEIFDMSCRGAEVKNYLEFLQDQGLEFDLDTTNEMLDLLMYMVNNLPSWMNNGWTPSQLFEMSSGRKIFRDEEGAIIRVGRNDSCPCGSGKKYKKCCGGSTTE